MLQICQESVNNQGVEANTCNSCFRHKVYVLGLLFIVFVLLHKVFLASDSQQIIYVLGLDMCTANSAWLLFVFVYVPMCAHVRPEVDIMWPSLLSTLFFGIGALVEPGTHGFGQATVGKFFNNRAISSAFCLLFCCWFQRMCTYSCMCVLVHVFVGGQSFSIGTFQSSLVYDTASCIIEMTYVT